MLMKRVLFLDKIYFKSLKRILLEQESLTFLWMKLLIFVMSFDKMRKRDGGGVMGKAVHCCCELMGS